MYEVVGLVTNQAKEYLAATVTTSFHFIVNQFSVHNSGHDPNSANIARTPNPYTTSPSEPLYGPAHLASRSVKGYVQQFDLKLAKHDAIGEISQYCLWATVTASPTGGPPVAVGSMFLYAVANRPLFIKSYEEHECSIKVRF